MNKRDIEELIEERLNLFKHHFIVTEYNNGRAKPDYVISAGSYEHAAMLALKKGFVKSVMNTPKNRKMGRCVYIKSNEFSLVDHHAKLFVEDKE